MLINSGQLQGIISRETFFRRVLPAIGLITFILLHIGYYIPGLIQLKVFHLSFIEDDPVFFCILFAFFAFSAAWISTFPVSWLNAHRLTAILVLFVYQFNPTRIHLTLPVLLVFYVYKIVSTGGRTRLHWSTSHWCMGAVFFLWMMSDLTFTKYLGYSSVYAGITFGSRFINSIFVLSFFRSKEDIRFLLRVFLFLVFVTTLVGSAQFLSYELTGYTKTFSNLSSMWAFIGGRRFIRVTGMMTHPSTYGYVCMLTSIACLYSFVSHRLTKTRPVLLLSMWAYFAVHAFISFSRATWIGWAAGMVILIVIQYWRNMFKVITIGSILIAILVLTGVVQEIVEFVVDINKTSLMFRINQLHYALEVFFEYPLTGLGTGQFPNAPGNFEKLHVHNTLLMVLTEGGLLTGLAYLLLLLVVMIRGLSCYFRCSEHSAKTYLGLFTILYISSFVLHTGQQAFYNSLPYVLVALIEVMIYIAERGGFESMEKRYI